LKLTKVVVMAAMILTLATGCSRGGAADAPTTVSPSFSEGPIEGAPGDSETALHGDLGLKPFEGGSYTWEATGVTMTTKVIRIEPWGERDDYCGDGTCGVSHPDDTRMVLRYTVTVPKSLAGTFDPSSCPGDMHVASGNDDESFIMVAGDHYKALDGNMMPGSAKYGDVEYSIAKGARNQEFFIESYCGDPEFLESAYFGGKIPEKA
jgi:hypothetical protein